VTHNLPTPQNRTPMLLLCTALCRHALIAAGRVHSVLATDELAARGRPQLTMCHR
jgi:hypothetical protein